MIIKEECWEPTKRQILTEEAAGTALLTLGAKEMDLPNKVVEEE